MSELEQALVPYLGLPSSAEGPDLERASRIVDQNLHHVKLDILIPQDSKTALGPCWDGIPPPELGPFYPDCAGSLPFCHLQPNWERALGRRAKRVWPGTTTMWVSWVKRMENVKLEEWQELGIDGAIFISCLPASWNPSLFKVLPLFWSST